MTFWAFKCRCRLICSQKAMHGPGHRSLVCWFTQHYKYLCKQVNKWTTKIRFSSLNSAAEKSTRRESRTPTWNAAKPVPLFPDSALLFYIFNVDMLEQRLCGLKGRWNGVCFGCLSDTNVILTSLPPSTGALLTQSELIQPQMNKTSEVYSSHLLNGVSLREMGPIYHCNSTVLLVHLF